MDCPKRRERDTEAVASAGLPDDPLLEILSRVPAKSLCRFKCVSKGWRDLIADPDNRKKLPQTLEGFYFMVELHVCHGESGCDDEPCACLGGDGEPRGGDDSDLEELPRYGFVDVLHRSVRLVDFSCLLATELPGVENSRLIHCCNGLLLFDVKCAWRSSSIWSYVVCNPATRECVGVPSSDVSQWHTFNTSVERTYLLFDPAGSPCHFNLVEFAEEETYTESVRVYSSKTETWTQLDLGCYEVAPHAPSVNDLLHLISNSRRKLTFLDVEGNIRKIIPPACQAGKEKCTTFEFVGWSQGCLHYITNEDPFDDEKTDGEGFGHTEPNFHGLLIWVLEDCERQQWVLKDTVSFSKLSGERNDHENNYDVVGIHPDHSLVFLVQVWDQKLISYHMDTKEVCDLCSLRHDIDFITPYVPCFLELFSLDNEQ